MFHNGSFKEEVPKKVLKHGTPNPGIWPSAAGVGKAYNVAQNLNPRACLRFKIWVNLRWEEEQPRHGIMAQTAKVTSYPATRGSVGGIEAA